MRFIGGLEREVGGSSDVGRLFQLIEGIHTPYCQLLVRYPVMETVLLKHKLHDINIVSVNG